MLLKVDSTSDQPLYQQIRDQIVSGIAQGELEPGMSLPSVRSLASDLGINLHTVNKAYALLRDEGYITMRGRAGAVIATPSAADGTHAAKAEQAKMEEALFKAALAHRARGGSRGEFLEIAEAQAARAFGVMGQHAEGETSKKSVSAKKSAKAGKATVASVPSATAFIQGGEASC